jgi:hypothetical protein
MLARKEAVIEEILGSHIGAIERLMAERAAVSGDIAEFGVYAGATTMQLAGLGRYVWAFDTFEGIPAEDYIEGLDRDEPRKFTPPPVVWERLARYPNIYPVIGRFEETLPEMPRGTRIVLAYLDCDLYLSAKCALHWLGMHLVENSVIVIDDYDTHPGIQKAVSEFLAMCPNKTRFDGHEVIYWRQS